MKTELKNLVGKKVLEIWANSEFMKFVTDQGNYMYQVTGDCCSSSFFYDFYGVENLLNRVVENVESIELLPSDVVASNNSGYVDLTQVYGYKITTTLPEDSWGGVTSVFSFRNISNGYYGGSIDQVEPKKENEYYSYHINFPVETGEMKQITKNESDLSK